jgi:hypothetical protein
MGTTTGFDAYQNPIKTAPSTETLTRVSLQPLLGTASTEANGADYDRTVTRWRLFAPAGTDLVTTDRIQQGSLDLEIDGEMVTWPGPDGQPHHIEVMLKRFGG